MWQRGSWQRARLRVSGSCHDITIVYSLFIIVFIKYGRALIKLPVVYSVISYNRIICLSMYRVHTTNMRDGFDSVSGQCALSYI